MTQRRPDEVMAELFAAMAEAGVEVVLLGGYAVRWSRRRCIGTAAASAATCSR